VETNITVDVHNSDEKGAPAGAMLITSNLDERIRTLKEQGLKHLSELASRQRDGVYGSNVLRRLQVPLEFSQVEMLEAELKNQGILPNGSGRGYSLTQIGSQESSLWCWRAERYGGKGKTLAFTMLLPEFVVSRAAELIVSADSGESSRQSPSASMHRKKIESPTSMREELNFLERFAAYLCGAYDHAENRYQRGLNLVLQVLSCSMLRQSQAEESLDTLHFCLPITKAEFLTTLKSAKLEKQVQTVLR